MNKEIRRDYVELVKDIKITKNSEEAFRKLCFVLGVFEEKGSIRRDAIKFIKDNIIGKMSEEEIIKAFNGFDIDKGYDTLYARFFMKHFSTPDFKKLLKNNLVATSYNMFDNIKNTNIEAKDISAERVHAIISSLDYVDHQNTNDYSNIFGNAASLFTEGKSDIKSDIKIRGKVALSKDNSNDLITYDNDPLDDPFGLIYKKDGNLYSSGFIPFEYDGKKVAVCHFDYELGTIILTPEIHPKFNEMMNKDETLQKAFVDCLKRVENNMRIDTTKIGTNVKSVFINPTNNINIDSKLNLTPTKR